MVGLWLWSGAALAVDADHDGWHVPADCNDHNLLVHPGALDVAGSGIDEDCDGRERCFVDADDDGARTPVLGLRGDADCADPYEGTLADPLDCDDGDGTISPLAEELVADGVDEDCDTHERCWFDNDIDGSGGPSTVDSVDLDCTDLAEALDDVDCDDANPLVFVGAAEVPGDAMDQNCDGIETCYADIDGDGARFGFAAVPATDLDCDDPGEAWVFAPFDCDDLDASSYPDAVELCDGIDNDCDGAVDPIQLVGPVSPVVGAPATWTVIGGPALTSASLQVGLSLGETAMAGCPGEVYDLAAPVRIASRVTDAAGAARLTGVPPVVAGQAVWAQVGFPATCQRSCVTVTPY